MPVPPGLYCVQVCQLESQLFEQFFPGSKDGPEQLSPLVEPLCTILYDVLRPTIINLQVHRSKHAQDDPGPKLKTLLLQIKGITEADLNKIEK